ncbi:hypothetical protein KCU71_g3951, partial [Aureobasidium melanogenum]
MGSIRGYMHVERSTSGFDGIPTKSSLIYGQGQQLAGNSKVRMTSLPLDDNEAVYPIKVQGFPIPNTDYKMLYLGEKNNLLESAPTEQSVAVFYMSCDDLDDMVVYVLIRKLEKNGKAMIAISIPWENCPYPNTASIPESDYSNLMIYFGPTGVLLTPGTVVELEIGLWATGMDFEEGESLSVQVSGEYPLADIFKGRGPKKPQVEERNKGLHLVHLGG